jgi:hypothetical protein
MYRGLFFDGWGPTTVLELRPAPYAQGSQYIPVVNNLHTIHNPRLVGKPGNRLKHGLQQASYLHARTTKSNFSNADVF